MFIARTRNLALAATVGYGALAAADVVATEPVLVAAFISDPELAPLAVDAVRLVALGLVFAGITPLASAYFQALGQVGPSYLLSIGTVVALKIPLVLVCSLAGPHGTWAAIPLGEALSTRQGIQFMLARMRVRVHNARLAWHHAARLRDAGRPFKEQAAIAKLTASDAAMDNARDATQIFGGNGFMNEYSVARHYRDSKILEIGEGTTEVQLLVIARSLGLGR